MKCDSIFFLLLFLCYVVKLLEAGVGQLLMGTNSGCKGFVYIDFALPYKVVLESEVTSQDTCQT